MTDSHAERRAAVIAAALLVPLAVLTWLVVIEWGPLMTFDQNVVDAWHGCGRRLGDARLLEVRRPGQLARTTTGSFLFIVAVVFLVRREVRTALWILVVALVTGPINQVFKATRRASAP